MAYVVYRACYTTERGTYRACLGHTRCVDLRKRWHSKKPPAWMKPRQTELNFEVLEAGLKTKEDALAAEALHSARALGRNPCCARGGLWVKPALPSGALAEAKAAAKLRSFAELFKLAADRPSGLLAKRLYRQDALRTIRDWPSSS